MTPGLHHLTAVVPTFLRQYPQRLLFIASIGNLQEPYTFTRHSAGHILLRAIEPLLQERIGFVHSRVLPSRPLFYQTWQCPSLMNVSGPLLTRRLKTWISDHRRIFHELVREGEQLDVKHGDDDNIVDVSRRPQFQPTLVILHDELEARVGQLKVRRGGPKQASLRGHRGLVSVMESLHGAGLLKQQEQRKRPTGSGTIEVNQDSHAHLAVLRIGVGIGRPVSRQRDDVANYVLTKMTAKELNAVQAAAGPVVDILAAELYRRHLP